jgi:hypothetical protein
MAKKGIDAELEKLTMEFLKQNDKDKKKIYKSERQMKRKSMKEMPISNLSKKKASEMDNKYFSILSYEDDI